MAQYAIIENGIVANVIVADAAYAKAAGAVEAGENCSIGASYSGGVFTRAPVSAPTPTLAQAQRERIAAIGATCQAAIYAGFESSALGDVHTYPASDTDQRNLIASVIASLLPGLPSGWTVPFWCADASGAWDMREHTAEQIQKAGSDGQTAITALRLQNAQLAAEVMAAATVAAVQAVTWTMPT